MKLCNDDNDDNSKNQQVKNIKKNYTLMIASWDFFFSLIEFVTG